MVEHHEGSPAAAAPASRQRLATALAVAALLAASTVPVFAGADLLMHECYTLTELPEEPWHCALETCAEMVEALSLGRLLLYHIREDQRLAVAAAAVAVPRTEVAATGSCVAVEARPAPARAASAQA